jgi:hypothetical protein
MYAEGDRERREICKRERQRTEHKSMGHVATSTITQHAHHTYMYISQNREEYLDMSLKVLTYLHRVYVLGIGLRWVQLLAPHVVVSAAQRCIDWF